MECVPIEIQQAWIFKKLWKPEQTIFEVKFGQSKISESLVRRYVLYIIFRGFKY
jgi:hypothetical protein